jgi:hypothetical protein
MEVMQGENIARLLKSEQMLTREYLESLTTNDLIRAADNFGIDMPPELDRILIIEELLEIACADLSAFIDEDDAAPASMPVTSTINSVVAVPSVAVGVASSVDTEADAETEASLTDSPEIEPVPLPEQYNITYIEVIIRDPFWAFVFWEIKSLDKEQFENTENFEGYYLKVSPVDSAAALVEGTFTVPIKVDDTGRYLGLNVAAKKTAADRNQRQTQHKVELCVGTTEGETVLAVSNPFNLPHLQELPENRESRFFAAENPIAVLSGYKDFRVVRGTERLPRKKRSARPV